jgi:hypothetical protein
MTDTSKSDPVEVMGEAYELLLENILKDIHVKEKAGGPSLNEIIEKARDETISQSSAPEGHIKGLAERLQRVFEKHKD